MPTRQEFLSFFGDDSAAALKYYEGINWDPRMVLTMKAISVKRLVGRQHSGAVGALVPTFQTGSECSEEEWLLVKKNYTELLRLQALYAPVRTAAETTAETEASSSTTPRQRKDASCGCSCVVM